MAEKTDYLPDTNTILRYLLDDHPDLSSKARIFWEEVRQGKRKAILTEGVLMECVYVLQRFYKVPRKETAANLKRLLAYKGVDQTNVGLFEAALIIYEEHSLDFVDCLLIAGNQQGQGVVFSFDEKINKLMSKSNGEPSPQ